MSSQINGTNQVLVCLNSLQCKMKRLNDKVTSLCTKPLFFVRTNDGTTISDKIPV